MTEMYWKKSYYGTGSIHYNDFRNTLLDTLIFSARNGSQSVCSSEEPIVHECVLFWCVKSIKSSYVWGNYHEEVTAILQNKTAGPWPWESFEVPEEEGGGSFTTYLENITIEAPISSLSRTNLTTPAESFGASNLTAYDAMAIFDDFFPSYYTADDASATPFLRYKNYPNGPSIRALDFNPWQAPNDVVSHMKELAVAITNAMRSNAESMTMVPGRAWNTKQYVLVRWGWLTFPLTLLVLSLAFLVATIIKTSDDAHSEMGVWKTSAMPTLIYSLPVEVQKDLRDSNRQATQVGSRARKLKIQLRPRQGWRVSGHTQGPQPPPGWI
ncbi:uncharacterized protein EKO05_0005939 [Ascochyta rabiei]|nr:uncharacterized protein EKO05_0005939 [Ascochyta rabiei]UPX15493.1 hypothetical protein EKO05_0005939 [Ascochyta rabiei]